MKKMLNKFMIMLILSFTFYSIVLPESKSYAGLGEIAYEAGKAVQTGMDWLDDVLRDAGSFVESGVNWAGIQIDMGLDTLTQGQWSEFENDVKNGMKPLMDMYTSFIEDLDQKDKELYEEQLNKFWEWLESEPSNDFEAFLKGLGNAIELQELYDVLAYKDFIPDRTGWYRPVTLTKTSLAAEQIVSDMYYYDGSKKVQPTKRWKTELAQLGTAVISPEVYLVKGKVYKIPSMATLNYNETNVLEQLEAMIAKFIYSVANGLHFLVSLAVGENVTIDELVFNEYGDTNITFFKDRSEVKEPSPLIYGENGVGGLDTVITTWYGFFRKIAIVGYMVILVYMGVKIMFTSTAEKKADYKQLFMNWLIGVAILLLFPYAMKYMIEINEAFVKTIEANKGYSNNKTSALRNMDYSKSLLDISIDEEIDWSTGTDYMSVIANAAYETEKIALALAFLIMTWQLIALLTHYYKRLFMIAFLIIIFPLVALSYAIDKIADGKSQAFDTWAKEFMLNVFVQTFHAIVYVFICSTVYSAGGTSESVGYDFILVIVGVTFLFSGEEIIRSIFGQVSKAGTMKGLADSAAATYMKLDFARKGIQNTASFIAGQKSIPYKFKRGAEEFKALGARRAVFDKTATKPEEYNPGLRLEHMPDPPDPTASEAEQKNYLQERSYFNAAAILNNPNSHSYEEKARALNKLKKLAQTNPHHDVFKDTKATIGQIAAMNSLDNDVQRMLTSGMSRQTIERNVKARLGVVFAGETKEQINDRVNTYFTALYFNGASSTVTHAGVKQEVEDVIHEVEKIQRSLNFGQLGPNPSASRQAYFDNVHNTVDADADAIYSKYESSLNAAQKPMAKEYARNIAVLMQRNSGVYNEAEILAAASYLKKNANANPEITQMLTDDFGMDIDMFMHTVARKITDDSPTSSAAPMARREVNDYERNPRDGYFDDEISVHQIIKDMKNRAEIDRIIQELYDNRRNIMNDATSNLGKEYLVDNQIDPLEGSRDMKIRTQEGDTEEELLVKQINVVGKTLKSLISFNTAGLSDDNTYGLGDRAMKEYLVEEKERRTGISRTKEEEAMIRDMSVTSSDFIEASKEKREQIDREHFLGDIGDRKQK